MLYQQPHRSLAYRVRAWLARLGALAVALRRILADTAYIDGLNDAALRDLGIRRIETRDDRLYR